jgi:anti-sigma B factor antagonist
MPDYLSVREQDGVTIVGFTLSSLTEESNIDQVGQELFSLVEQFDCRSLVVSLRGVIYITSSGLGKLITLHRKMHRLKGQVAYCEVEPVVEDILKTSRLFNYFVITPDVQSAVESVR